ncbi:Casein Kinase 2 substrate [Trema orientale]|uniref:Casein Kinase 2 substrate n=1 Tax=Trema orientale TaxID=63057 RepID=A0A2P5G0H2_TREOI|nr:Casein Kinase 2 substrate [Trema orientale]
MDSMIKKFQQRFKKVRREMERWEELQSRLRSHFRNAASIIQRLQMLNNIKNYDSLNCVNGTGDEVLMKQMANRWRTF